MVCSVHTSHNNFCQNCVNEMLRGEIHFLKMQNESANKRAFNAEQELRQERGSFVLALNRISEERDHLLERIKNLKEVEKELNGKLERIASDTRLSSWRSLKEEIKSLQEMNGQQAATIAEYQKQTYLRSQEITNLRNQLLHLQEKFNREVSLTNNDDALVKLRKMQEIHQEALAQIRALTTRNDTQCQIVREHVELAQHLRQEMKFLQDRYRVAFNKIRSDIPIEF